MRKEIGKGLIVASLLATSLLSVSGIASAQPTHISAAMHLGQHAQPGAWSLTSSELRAQASTLRENSTTVDRLRHPGDVIVYRLQPRSGRLSFSASGVGTSLTCEIYDDSVSSGPIQTVTGSGSRGCELDLQLVSSRTYWVAVRGATRNETGEFRARYSISTPASTQGANRTRAIRLDRGRDQQGTLAPREERWYEIRLTTDVRVDIEVESRGSMTCEILDSRGRKIESHSASGSRDCELDLSLTSGTYYVMLKSNESSRYLDYELEFDTQSIRDDHSNSRSGATNLSRSRSVSGFLTRGDKDFFSLGYVNGRTRIETQSAEGTDTLCIVYDERGREIARDNNGGLNRQCRVDFQATGARYFVEVRGASSSTTGSYSISYR